MGQLPKMQWALRHRSAILPLKKSGSSYAFQLAAASEANAILHLSAWSQPRF
jgi:hypothetical protein